MRRADARSLRVLPPLDESAPASLNTVIARISGASAGLSAIHRRYVGQEILEASTQEQHRRLEIGPQIEICRFAADRTYGEALLIDGRCSCVDLLSPLGQRMSPKQRRVRTGYGSRLPKALHRSVVVRTSR